MSKWPTYDAVGPYLQWQNHRRVISLKKCHRFDVSKYAANIPLSNFRRHALGTPKEVMIPAECLSHSVAAERRSQVEWPVRSPDHIVLRGHNQSVILVNKPRNTDELKDKITRQNVSESMLPYCRIQLSCLHWLSSCFYLKRSPVYISKYNISETILPQFSGKIYSVCQTWRRQNPVSETLYFEI